MMTAEKLTPAAGRVSIREYFSTVQELYTKADARVIGPELERLSADGKTRPRDIVDAARPEAAALHPYFEWDDQRAAEGFRQMQAGRMARTIMVYVAGAGQEREEPAFRSVAVRVVGRSPAAPVHEAAAVQVRPKAARSDFDTIEVRSQGRQSDVGRQPATTPAQDAPPLVTAAPVSEEAADDALIGEALAHLQTFEHRFGERRVDPTFGSVFEPVFVAIGEARERAGEGTLS